MNAHERILIPAIRGIAISEVIHRWQDEEGADHQVRTIHYGKTGVVIKSWRDAMNRLRYAVPDNRPVQRCCAWARSRGRPCRAPAMANGRCKLHGGLSTGPKTPEGRARALANLKQYRHLQES